MEGGGAARNREEAGGQMERHARAHTHTSTDSQTQRLTHTQTFGITEKQNVQEIEERPRLRNCRLTWKCRTKTVR